MISRHFLFGICVLTLGVGRTLHAADPSAGEAKLRESLRSATLQLRTMQGERDALQAAKIQLEQEKQTLTQQMEAMTKRLDADKATSDKLVGELKGKLEERDGEIGRLKESVEQWKAAQKKAADTAETKEAERARLAAQGIELQRHVADQRTKNAAMFKIGNEILTRYEKFGLGTALAAREPFVGTMRVKLENLVQDYGDKLAEQKIKPGTEPGKERGTGNAEQEETRKGSPRGTATPAPHVVTSAERRGAQIQQEPGSTGRGRGRR